MGGAVTLLLHRKDPPFWDGALLVAPMCKVCNSFEFIVWGYLTKLVSLI